MILLAVLYFTALFITLKLCAVFIRRSSKLRYCLPNPDAFTIGFFHPFCNSGGGGERVLWSAIKTLQDNYPNCVCVVYTGDCESTAEEIIRNASERLNVQLCPVRTKFVYLRLRFLTLDKYYPVFTLLGQSLGSVVLGIEALLKFIPDIYFETTGQTCSITLFFFDDSKNS